MQTAEHSVCTEAIMSFLNEGRNPLIIPERGAPNRGRCPKCGASDYTGRRVQGVVTFTCRVVDCGGLWYGGLPQEPTDPRLPTPPMDPNDQPPISFGQDNKGQPIEIRKHVNLTPLYRRGGSIPEGEK